MPRVIHPSDRLARALRAAEQGLSVAERAGFSTLADGVRASVLASERLVQVLELLVDRGFSPRGASSPVPAERVVGATTALRAAVGVLAQTTPGMFSSHYAAYRRSLDELLAVAREVAGEGVTAQRRQEPNEWDLFRPPN